MLRHVRRCTIPTFGNRREFDCRSPFYQTFIDICSTSMRSTGQQQVSISTTFLPRSDFIMATRAHSLARRMPNPQKLPFTIHKPFHNQWHHPLHVPPMDLAIMTPFAAVLVLSNLITLSKYPLLPWHKGPL
jgi:hypothetical protein